jgi:hypothetical protein
MRTAAALLAALAFVPVAAAKDGVHATLTTPLPKHASMGTKLAVSFTLRDAAGHPFDAMKIFVKIICPTKDASSFVFARQLSTGHYRAVAIVPPGGLGTVRIGIRGWNTAGKTADVYFPIRNH